MNASRLALVPARRGARLSGFKRALLAVSVCASSVPTVSKGNTSQQPRAMANQATNSMEIKETGIAWGQLRDLVAWYQKLVTAGNLVPGAFKVTGYSLGGHLASAFNEMHPGAASQVVTSNGAANHRSCSHAA